MLLQVVHLVCRVKCTPCIKQISYPEKGHLPVCHLCEFHIVAVCPQLKHKFLPIVEMETRGVGISVIVHSVCLVFRLHVSFSKSSTP